MGPRTGAFIVAVALAAPFLAGCNKINPRIVGLSSLKDSATPFSLAGTPASPSNVSALNVFVLSSSFTEYRFAVGPAASTNCQNAAIYSSPVAVTQAIGSDLSGFTDGELILCVSGVDANSSSTQLGPTLSHRWTKDTISPAKPTVIALASGVTNPGNDKNPRITVGSTTPGDLIEIFKDPTCSVPAGSATAVGTSTTVTSFTLAGDGSYNFYARATDPAGNKSGCSNPIYASYNLDVTAPTILKVFANAVEQGWHYFGEAVLVKIQFSEAVVISGTPRLKLNTGATRRQATFDPAHAENTDTIKVFRYVVDADDYSPELDYDSVNAFVLSGGATVADAAGNPVVATLPELGAGNSLKGNPVISVNGLSAEVSLSNSPVNSPLPFGTSQDFSIDVKNTGGRPILTISSSQSGSTAFTALWNSCSGTLQPDQVCQYTFRVQSPGEVTESFTFALTFNDGSGDRTMFLPIAAVGSAAAIDVLPRYPLNGAQWNDYVSNLSLSVDRESLADAPCGGSSESTVLGCIHGGEIKSIGPLATSSCDNLQLTETLGFFNWKCVVNGSSVYFFSRGLKDSSRLADLIDPALMSWRLNKIEIARNGILLYRSPLTAWWSNPIHAVTSNTQDNFTETGAIYVVNSDLAKQGINLGASKQALVIMPGHVLKFDDSASVYNCNSTSGKPATGNSTCLVAGGSVNHLWLEGEFNGVINSTVAHGLLFKTNFSRFRHLQITNTGAGGALVLKGAKSNLVHHLRVANVSQNSLSLSSNSTNNTLADIFINNTTNDAIAIDVNGSDGNNLIRVFSAFNKAIGINLGSATNTTLAFFTSANNTKSSSPRGLSASGLSNSLFLQGQVFNNDGYGIYVDGTATNNFFDQIFTSSNGTYDIYDTSTGSAGFHNNLYAQTCNSAALNSSCAPTGASTANSQNSPQDLSTLIHGATGDGTNPQGSGGLIDKLWITDWFRFDSPMRIWGIGNSPFPNSSQRGSCYVLSGANCFPWDFRPVVGNAVTGINGSFIPNATCPIAASGAAQFVQNHPSTGKAFLINAMEIIGDGEGNDNGLCEDNEACIFAPNFGYYQGEGDLQPCTYTDGAVSGVKMFGHIQNGY